VKQLQDYLVQNGFLTAAQRATGYGTYGPQTTAAVAALQKSLGVDNSSGVGYYGPKTIAAATAKAAPVSSPTTTTAKSPPVSSATGGAQSPTSIQQLQQSLGVPVTGVYDAATSKAMDGAVTKSIAADPNVQQYGGSNDPADILQAYQTGDWSGVTSLSGKPFTDAQQQAAVAQATSALAPAYDASTANDTATTTEALQKTGTDLANTENTARTQFKTDKNTLDQNAADNGVLFAGARTQKENALASSYANTDAINRANAASSIGDTARSYQYAYGNGAAQNLSSLYNLPGAPTYNASVAGGQVRPSGSLSAVYNPSTYNFQGTAPVAQTTNVQTRAANLLANNANKLSLSGVGAKF
jgi:hypothetical protein